jgi:hypothetical protein
MSTSMHTASLQLLETVGIVLYTLQISFLMLSHPLSVILNCGIESLICAVELEGASQPHNPPQVPVRLFSFAKCVIIWNSHPPTKYALSFSLFLLLSISTRLSLSQDLCIEHIYSLCM